ncbi:MAG: hypothetical protein EA403_10620 [Spirochaetaceae bacterium]|nr:MAG: hypothetical protein EA403_10620 [Spirochaetaceae bacterium]
MENTLNILSRKAGFNTALRHFQTVTAFVEEIGEGYNFADVINEQLSEGSLQRYQVRSMLNALLVEKFGYAFRSHNMNVAVESADKIVAALAKWGRIQFVVAYHHPQAGLIVLNPRDESQWAEALPLAKDELLVVYAGSSGTTLDDSVLSSAVDDFYKILYGKSVKEKKEYLGPVKRRSAKRTTEQPVAKPKVSAKSVPKSDGEKGAAAPAAAEDSVIATGPIGSKRITPRYSVLVTNELFHNGNVEAWKKIIQSYRGKYAGLDVLIWYENERINDINALFKWGKVKHGTPIMFSVAGDAIKDVSKLQRYLFEGASPRFEVFLHGSVDRVLDLF